MFAFVMFMFPKYLMLFPVFHLFGSLNLHQVDDIGVFQGSVLLASLPWKCNLRLCVFVSALLNLHQVDDNGLSQCSGLLASLLWKCQLRLCVTGSGHFEVTVKIVFKVNEFLLWLRANCRSLGCLLGGFS